MFDVVADVSTCTLHAKTKVSNPLAGTVWRSWEDPDYKSVTTKTGSFKDVDSFAVESFKEYMDRTFAEQGTSDATYSSTPAVYYLTLKGTKKDAFSFHSQYSSPPGFHAAKSEDSTKRDASFIFRDEQTADRVAKAMVHAVELCGGGAKPEPF
jgi:hypothetical protein